MKTKEYLLQLVNYNVWANQLLAAVMLNLSDEVLDAKVNSSFDSIRNTVHHIWDAEYIWLCRLNGVSLGEFPSKGFKENPVIDTFLTNSKDFAAKVTMATPEFFEQSCRYKNLQQKEFANTNAEIIVHCMNHSTYHRGQLVTLLRQAGCSKLPATDFIAFLRE